MRLSFSHTEECTWGERVTLYRELRAEASPRDTKAKGHYFIISKKGKEGAWQIQKRCTHL